MLPVHSLLFAGAAILAQGAFALPSLNFRDLPSDQLHQCAHQPLYSVFHAKSHKAVASAFCSAYIGPQTTTKTRTVYVHSTATDAITTTVTPTTTTLTVTNSADVTTTVTAVVHTTLTLSTTQTVTTDTDIFLATSKSTTTDTTSVVTETSLTTFTTTDATSVAVISTVSYTTVTAAAPSVYKRGKKGSKCGGNKAPWLSSVTSAYPSSDISSACSCLVEQTTVTDTITKVGSNVTATSEAFVSATASSFAIKDITNVHSTYATTTESFSTTKVYNATATTSVTQTVVQTVDATATTTTTTTLTVTDFETLYTSSTTTDIATVTAVASSSSTSGQCSALGSTYNAPNGKQFATHCGTYFQVSHQIGALSYHALFSDCVYTCSITAGCLGVDYDKVSGLCEMFDLYVSSGQAYDSALLLNP